MSDDYEVIDPADLVDRVSRIMERYGDKFADLAQEAIDKGAEEARKSISEKSPVKTGQYRGGWAIAQNNEGTTIESVVYQHARKRSPLTHLLENGHMSRDGSWTEGKPHIKQAYQVGIKEIDKVLRFE